MKCEIGAKGSHRFTHLSFLTTLNDENKKTIKELIQMTSNTSLGVMSVPTVFEKAGHVL